MPYKEHVHTITADNGPFANHEEIAKVLDKVYFAHPYRGEVPTKCEWSTSGNIKPKGTVLRLITALFIWLIEDKYRLVNFNARNHFSYQGL